jgi:hypothetical protein
MGFRLPVELHVRHSNRHVIFVSTNSSCQPQRPDDEQCTGAIVACEEMQMGIQTALRGLTVFSSPRVRAQIN